MKLIRFGAKGQECPGLLQKDGIVNLRAIFSDIPDINELFFSQGWLERLMGVQVSGEKMEVRLSAPVANPSKIICLGKNYMEHAKEGGFDTPTSPLIFCKTPNSLNGPYDSVLIPQSSDQIDWEVELAIIIGKTGKRISKQEALAHIAGVTVINDVSARRANLPIRNGSAVNPLTPSPPWDLA